MPITQTTPTYLFQIRYNDTCVKFDSYANALKWCRDASREGIKNVIIEKARTELKLVS